tara:strand:- start:1428 stop:2207 length:780 start_codon:yes stop_codon:yes gene_type:complete
MKMITLLDGTVWRYKDILPKLDNDDFYYGELGTNALSSSSIKLLVDSPKKYYYVTNYAPLETQGLRDGKLLHQLILENDKFEKNIFVDVQSKNTKKYKEALKKHGTVYTMKERTDAERLGDALLKNDYAVSLLKNARFEVAEIGYVNDWIFRGKADILGEGGTIVDIKTTTDIKGFKYAANKYGYDIQAYIYCQLFNVNYFDFKFLVLDKGSLDIGIFEVTEETYLRGKEKTEIGIKRYEDWFTKGEVNLDNYYIKDII